MTDTGFFKKRERKPLHRLFEVVAMEGDPVITGQFFQIPCKIGGGIGEAEIARQNRHNVALQLYSPFDFLSEPVSGLF